MIQIKVTQQTHPRWEAPEVLRDNELFKQSDVYSFGIVMYEALTWRLPFFHKPVDASVRCGHARARAELCVQSCGWCFACRLYSFVQGAKLTPPPPTHTHTRNAAR